MAGRKRKPVENPFGGNRVAKRPERHSTYTQTSFAQRRSPRGETPLCRLDVPIETALDTWLRDRAAIVGMPVRVMARDVLALWANLVIEAERSQGVDLTMDEGTIHLPERGEGYWPALLPAGFTATHLDDSPLGLGELEREQP